MRGLTLIELLVALAVVAVLTALAAPAAHSLSSAVARQVDTFRLRTLLHYARARAVSGAMDVGLCTAIAPDGPCGAASGGEWLVFADVDGDGAFHAGDDRVLRAAAGHGTGTVVRDGEGRAVAPVLRYRADGTARRAQTFHLCGDDGAAKGVRFVISVTGRVRIAPAEEGACAEP
jgi:type IV fimbrial biogenesis protein FimT